MGTIFVASDHAAFKVKEELKEILFEKGLELKDLGTVSEESCHYPLMAEALARKVANGEGRGVLLCGSGIGVSMVANRFKGARAALCRTVEDARLSREHNNANIICLGARMSSLEEIHDMLEVWLSTEFEGGRHQERISLFDQWGERP